MRRVKAVQERAVPVANEKLSIAIRNQPESERGEVDSDLVIATCCGEIGRGGGVHLLRKTPRCTTLTLCGEA